MDTFELLFLLVAGAVLAAAAARARHTMPARRLMRRTMGYGALIGAAALAFAD